MKKYKIYSPDKKYEKDTKLLFINYFTNDDMNVIEKYSNKTILYDSKDLFFNNLEKIKKILKKKLNIITFDFDIQMVINKVRNKKKELIGLLANEKSIDLITELEKIFLVDFSYNIEYFNTKDIPLFIFDIENTPEYNKLLENRMYKNNKKTYIVHQDYELILYKIFANIYWDDKVNFMKIYDNYLFSDNIEYSLKNKITNKYNINKEYKNDEPLIYFGDCNNDDFIKIINHKNIVFIVWIDIEPENKQIIYKTNILKNKNNILHFAMTKFLLKNLEKYNIYSILFTNDIEESKNLIIEVININNNINNLDTLQNNISEYIFFRKQKILRFKQGQYYILLFEGCIITDKLEYGIQFIEGVNDKEFIIYYYAENDLEIEEIEFIKTQKINYEIKGYNPVYLMNIDVHYLYYVYGCLNNNNILLKIGLLNIYNYYKDNIESKKYNVELLKRKWCYDLGKNGEILDISNFTNFVLKYSDNIITKKCLFISKKINGFGGNQKTALQIVQLLEKYFIIEIFSNNIRNNNYNYIVDALDFRIHNMKIIKKNNNITIQDINENYYYFIINNKFDEYFKIFAKIIHPRIYFITHNSMDPFNRLIIQNQNYIRKVLTINLFHHNVLSKNGLKINTGVFLNTIDEEIAISKRDNFKNRICFIGRFSKEKNLELLIASMKFLNEIELIIIGGENEFGIDNKNIIWKGPMQKDQIISELRECDYLIVPSSSEGLPFVILEAMNIGIPCIYSDIIGADELIKKNGERGFTFKLEGYKKCMMNLDWSVFKEVDKNFEENVKNLKECIENAYLISIMDWNLMSEKCKNFVRNTYYDNITSKKNLESLEIIL